MEWKQNGGRSKDVKRVGANSVFASVEPYTHHALRITHHPI